MKSKYYLLLLILPILFWVGCEDKETDADGLGAEGPGYVDGSPSGTYMFTGVTLFESATCEGEGITHMCTDNIDNQADCEAAGEEWLPLIDVFTGGDPAGAPYIIFGADGLLINPDCGTEPFTVDGTTITIIEGHCESETVNAEDEATCTAAGGSWVVEYQTATINEDGTIIFEFQDPGHCRESEGETETECVSNGGEWSSPKCQMIELTYDETHDGSCVNNGCEEHSDCDSNYCSSDGECIDCPYEYDCNGECGGGDDGYECSDGSYECNEEDCPVNILGTYTAISAVSHPGGDCSAAGGVAGICITDSTATTEAACPAGMCMDGSGADEASCTEGMWLIGMCLDDDGNGVEDESVQASADACTTAGYQWMAMGWMNLIDAFGDFSITFADDGTFTDPDGESGTWSLDGSTLTITDSEGEINTGTVSGNTITVELYDEAECYDDDGNNTIDAADEAACEAAGGAWEDAECIEVVFTSSGS